jgi:glycosyltransferase involved in cell wall biosynthesis
MKALFLHQNMPGQFRYLAPALARQPGNEVIFLTRRSDVTLPDIRRVTYKPRRTPHPSTHRYVRSYEDAVLHGQEVARTCLDLAREDFYPDVIVAHPGWGEALFVKDAFPRARLLNYCEYYYRGRGADVGFDPTTPADLDTICRARARNAHLLLSLEACDRGWSPTEWQRYRHPAWLLPKIAVVHDGIETRTVRPDPDAVFSLPDGTRLTRDAEVVTYASRNLEPYRGFPSFMRALPELLRRRPSAQVVIAGGDDTSYGPPPAGGVTWREALLKEVGPLDPARVHFVGHLPYAQYLRLLQISSVHVYLTVPFVLSWSCLEAMAVGAVVVGSRTPPVQEVIEDGRNGLLVDFFDPASIAMRVADALDAEAKLGEVRARARESVLARYDLRRCLTEQMRLVQSLA